MRYLNFLGRLLLVALGVALGVHSFWVPGWEGLTQAGAACGFLALALADTE